jgi:5-methylcytosine-specific restriction endonuclease McrA
MDDQKDKQRISRVAELIRSKLEEQGQTDQIRWRRVSSSVTNTQGWMARLGSLGRGKPYLEIWLDRYAGRSKRYFWFGFYSPHPRAMQQLLVWQSDSLQPIRTLGDKDIEKVGRDTWLLAAAFRRDEFSAPINEKYDGKHSFYGVFDPTLANTRRYERLVARRAVAFFGDVLRALPHATPARIESGIYAREENRQRVVQHLARERSSLLAEDRKIRDKYNCQVCGMNFEDVYGALGREFAEAHHIVPLSQLKRRVRTALDDLATVCSNCHRMLHKMEGKRDDVAKLRKMVREHRKA